MNDELRRLLVELAKTVLRVLDTHEPAQKGTAKNRADLGGALAKPIAISTIPAMAVIVDPAPTPPRFTQPQRGDAVRIWAGDRYETGTVKAICRGEPRRLWVTISRGEGKRAKKVRVESDKAVVVKTAQDIARAAKSGKGEA